MAYRYINIREEFDRKNDISFGPNFADGEDLPGVFGDLNTTPDAIRAKIRMVLLTKKGERYMLPQFGSNLLNVLFEPNDSGHITELISNAIYEAIKLWVPAVSIENITVKTEDTDPGLVNTVDVSFQYSIDGYEPFTFELWYNQETGKMKIDK